MSAFAIPYMVGNILKRDHQFWPTIEDPTESFSDITLAMLMQMAWRVREWTVSGGSFSFSGTNPVTTDSWSMNGTWDEFLVKMKRKGPTWDEDGLYRDVTDERDILGPSNESSIFPTPHTLLNAGVFGGIGLSSGEYREPADGEPGAVSGGVNGRLLGGLITFNDSTKKFNILNPYAFGFFGNPAIGATGLPQVFFGIAEGGTAGSFTFNDSSGAPGFTCGIEITGRHTVNGANEGSGTVSDITMTATKWWPYSNSLGQAIYDTTTGEPTGANRFA